MAKKTTRKRARRRTAPAPATVAGINLERMLLSDLEPHPRNAEIRQHPEPDTPKWRELEISLQHDYYDPLVFNTRNGFLVSGHLRRKVLISLGFTHADVVVVDYDEATHMARMLSANRGAGEDDMEGIKGFFEDFATMEGFVPALAGFTDGNIRELLPDIEAPWLAEDDEESEYERGEEGGDAPMQSLPEDVIAVINERVEPDIRVVRGEVWVLGSHRLYCVPLVASPEREWAQMLSANPELLFIPLPDPYAFLNAEHPESVAVQPDAFVASMIVSNYVRVFGEGSASKIR